MDIDKLIERLYKHHTDWGEGRTQDFFKVCLDCKEAATALSTLQAENAQLRDKLENYRKGHCTEGGCAAERDRDAVLAELEKVKEKYDAAIEYLREIEWCAGCKHFGGLDGCKKWAMGQCTEKHDLYEFVGPQKED